MKPPVKLAPIGLGAIVGQLLACSHLPAGSIAVDTKPYVIQGRGALTVVLQAGLGDDRQAWDELAPLLTGRYQVFSYDRPGRNGWELPAGVRDPCTIAVELHGLLAEAGVTPPYVLVGHSLGGLYQYVYAHLYPHEVAAMVLLDPVHPQHWESLQTQAPSAAFMLRTLRAVAFSEADRAEFDAQAQCLDELHWDEPPPMPTKVLLSGQRRPEERGAFTTMLERLRADWLRFTSAHQLEVIADAGHYLQRDAPARVAQAVHDLASEVGVNRGSRFP